MPVREGHARGQTDEPPPANLKNSAAQPLRRDVELIGAQLLAVDPHPAAGDEPPGLPARHSERLADHRGDVHRIAVGKREIGDILGNLVTSLVNHVAQPSGKPGDGWHEAQSVFHDLPSSTRFLS